MKRTTFFSALAVTVGILAYAALAQSYTYFPAIALGIRPDSMVVNGAAITSQLEVNSNTASIIESHTHAGVGGLGGVYYAARSRGTSAAPTVVASGDQLSGFYSVGYDGTDYAIGASITAAVSGTPGANDMPTALSYCTTADGASTPANCMTQDPNGKLTTVATVAASAGFNMPHGTAPTSPANGDMWTTTAGLYVRVNGATVGPLSAGVQQSTGFQPIDWNTACATTPTQSWSYVVTGKVATVGPVAQMSCTGDVTTFTNSGSGTAIPASARPSVTQCFPVTAVDNGADTAAMLQVTTAGVISLFKGSTNCTTGAWTASGTRSFPADNTTLPSFTWQVP